MKMNKINSKNFVETNKCKFYDLANKVASF